MAETNETPERNVKRQQYLVEKAQLAYEEKPSEDAKLKLDRETDLLRQLLNAEKGDVKNRAEEKADFARDAVRGRAIQQVPQE